MSDLPSAPLALRDAATGFPAFGRYAGLIRDLSTATWDGTLGPLSPRRTQRKTWVYLGAFSERFMAGFAIADAGLVASAFVYVFDREQRTLIEEKLTVPFGFGRAFEGRVDQPWELSNADKLWRIVPRAGGWSAEFSCRDWRLKMELAQSGKGMSTVAQSPQRPFNFTYKDCALDATLSLTRGGQAVGSTARGMVDFTLGYPPRRTFWNWAAGCGRAGDQALGFNLVAHFNNGLENGLWLGGRMLPLAQAGFVYDPRALNNAWRIVSADGVLDLRFEPEGRRAENINALVASSRFVQLFGRFGGTLRLDGRELPIDAFGVTEEHHAVW